MTDKVIRSSSEDREWREVLKRISFAFFIRIRMQIAIQRIR